MCHDTRHNFLCLFFDVSLMQSVVFFFFSYPRKAKAAACCNCCFYFCLHFIALDSVPTW